MRKIIAIIGLCAVFTQSANAQTAPAPQAGCSCSATGGAAQLNPLAVPITPWCVTKVGVSVCPVAVPITGQAANITQFSQPEPLIPREKAPEPKREPVKGRW